MNNKRKEILEKIRYYQKQKKLLIEARKKQISEIITKAGGIGFDDRLLAGLVIFALKEKANSKLLEEILDMGNKVLKCQAK